MNKTFHSVWNASKQAYVAAAETVSAKGKPSSGVKVAAVMAGLLGSLLGQVANAQTAPPPNTLPTGGQVSAGQASISQSGANMVINQSSNRASVNWQSFNVGKDAHVQFNQPSAASVTFNRVMSADPSQIFGRITANGQVVLSNPAGVYFGKNARVDVGGIVATTHGMSDADFMAGKNRLERNGSMGKVVNEGEIKAALGGYIALLAPEVRNQGAVIAHMGTVALAAGEAVDLQFDTKNRLTSIRVEPSQIAALVDNRHAVQAPGGLIIISAQSMDRLVGGVVKNSGRIEANGLQQQGGRIVLSASKRIDNTGTISANATTATAPGSTSADSGPAGRIEISAPEVSNSGTISATGSPQQSAGSVQVQATQFTQTDTGRIDLSAPTQGGKLSIQTSGKVQLQGSVSVQATQDNTPSTPNTQGGQISIEAQGDLELNNATLDASGGQGGSIQLLAGAPAQASNPNPLPTTPLAPNEPGQGRLAMMGQSTLTTRGRTGQGGGNTLQADHIALLDNTTIDAQGATGGGHVLVGGDWQGGANAERRVLADPNALHQATTVTMAQGASINASATQNGDGGTVVLWSDVHRDGGSTDFAGQIQARGGAQSGHGGHVETSGKTLRVAETAQVNTTAPHGTTGHWLLDPTQFTISAGSGAQTSSGIGADTLVNNLANSSITIATDSSGGAEGSIFINADIVSASANNLTFKAHHSINHGDFVDVNIGGHLTYWADSDNNRTGSILIGGTTSLSTRGGNITMAGGADNGSGAPGGSAVQIWGWWSVDINSNGGDITMRANATTSLGGVIWNGPTTVNAGTGRIVIDAQSDTGTALAFIDTLTMTSARNDGAAISMTGIANNSAYGLIFNNAQTKVVKSTGTGSIDIVGQGNTYGVYLDTTQILAASGAINIKTDTGAGTSAIGVSTGNTVLGQGGGIASSSSAINITTNRLDFSASGGIALASSGAATIQPSGASFSHTLDTARLTFGSSLTGLTLGKEGNAQAITLTDALSIAGPISLIGGNITLNSGLTSTASGAEILIKASGNITTNANTTAKTITTNNGHVVLWSDGDANGSGVLNLDHVTVNPGSGNVTVRAETASWTLASKPVINGTGVFTFEPGDAIFGQQMDTNFFSINSSLTGLNFGKSGNTATILVSSSTSIAGPINIFGGDITLNAGLTATGTNTITLQGSGNVTDGANGFVSATNLLLTGGNVTLDRSTNFITTLAASGVSNLTYVDWNSIAVGTVGSTAGISAAGAVSITANGNLDLNANVATTVAAGHLTLKTTGFINQANNVTVTTQGGNQTYWADSDSNNSGSIVFLGAATLQSNGGHITLAGGADSGSGTPAGGAYQLRSAGALTINTGGGDLRMKSVIDLTYWAMTFNEAVNFNSGTGSITIDAQQTGTGRGLTFNGPISITSSKASGTAISITGSAGSTNASYGVVLESSTTTSHPMVIKSTSGGAINITSATGSTNTPLVLENVSVLSASGDINIDGGAAGITIRDRAATTRIGAQAGEQATSSSKVTLTGGKLTVSTPGNLSIDTTGQVIIQPSSTSFSSTLDTTRVTFGTGITDLTLGKTGNTSAITIGSPISINGPITATGGTLTLSSGVTTTNTTTGDVTLNAATVTGSGNIAIANGRALSVTQSGNSTYSGIVSGTGSTLTKLGAGTLTLTGANSYTGATTITSGGLIFSNNTRPSTTGFTGAGQLTIEPTTSFSADFNTNSYTYATTLTSLTFGKSGNTSNIIVGNPITISGPISMEGGAININADLNSSATSGSGLLAKASGNIIQLQGKTVTTSGADVTYWADSDASGAGGIRIGSDTAGVYTTAITTSGGNLTLGGGLSLASGFAMYDAALGAAFSTYFYGVGIFGATLNASGTTTGGHVVIRGNGGVGTTAKVFAVNIGGQYGTNTNVLTSHSGSITVVGNNSQALPTNNNPYGINSGATFQTASGSILIQGTANAAKSNARGMLLTGKVQSTSGSITLDDLTSNTTSGNYTGSFLEGLSLGKGSLASSSSNIAINIDEFSTTSATNIDTSGTLTLLSNSAEFTGPLSWNAITSNLTAFTVGKVGNTANITIGSPVSVNGPITATGGTLTLTGNITTTNTTTGDVTFNAATVTGSGNIAIANGRALSVTQSGNSTYSGIISGTGSTLTKLGAGTLTLSGVSSYTGATTITNGGLIFSNNTRPSTTGFTGAGQLTIEPGTSFSAAFNTNSYTYATTLTSLTFGKSGNTANIIVGNPITISGPISMVGGNIDINANLTSTGAVSAKASGYITQAADVSITSSGGNVTYWADSDDNATGAITFGGQGSITTNGGKLTLAGGADSGSGSPNGYAVQILGANTGDLSFSTAGGDVLLKGKNTVGSGIRIYAGLSVNAGSGNISIDGQSAASGFFGVGLDGATSLTTTGGAVLIEGQSTGGSGIRATSNLTIDSGTGSITLNGQTTASGSFGLQINGTTSFTSSKVSGTAISLNGTSASSRGIVLETTPSTTSNLMVFKSTGGGGISLNSSGTQAMWLDNVRVLAASGNITVSSPAGFTAESNANATTVFGRQAGLLDSSSSNITITTNVLNNLGSPWTGNLTVDTTGQVTLKPSSTSFSSTVGTDRITWGSSITGLTLGQSGNTANINIGAININGPISVEGGTLNLGGDITTTNTTTGDITLNAATVTGSGNIALASGRALSVTQSGNSTYSGIFSGTGSTLTKLGAGTLTLTGANSYTGVTTITAGTLQVGDGSTTGALGSGAVTNNAALSFNRSNDLTVANTISGTGTLNQLGAGTLTLTGANSYTGITTITAGTLQVGDGGTTGTLGSGAVTNNAALTFNRSNGLTVANVISGSGTLTKLGAGTLTLSGASSYAGITTISAGALRLGAAGDSTNSPLGTIAAGTVVQSGATLDLYGFSLSTAEPLSITGAGSGAVGQVGALVNYTTTNVTYSGLLSLGGSAKIHPYTGSIDLSNTGTITGSGYTLTLSGQSGDNRLAGILDLGAGGLTLSAADSTSWTLSGANTYTGPTAIDGGTLKTTHISALGNGSAVTMLFNTNALLDISGGDLTIGSLALTASTIPKVALGSSTLTIGTNNTSTTFGGVISGAGAVTKVGTGTLTLPRGNTYTGATTVSAGTLAVSHAAALGTTASGTTVASGATLDLRNVAVGAEALTINGGTLASSNGTSSLSGSVVLGADSTVNVGGLELTVSGVVSGTGFGFTKTGMARLVLSGSNSYTGATTVNAGTLLLGAAGDATNTPLGTAAAGTVVASGATLDLNGFTLGTAEALTINGTGMSSAGAMTNSSATAASYSGLLTLGSNSTIKASSGHIVLSNTGTITGSGFALTLDGTSTASSLASILGTDAGGLTKSGTGTWTLAGDNTYTGTTTVSAGTLQVGAGSTTGALGSGAISNNAALTFNRSNDLTVANTISGSGTLTKLGVGTLTLTGANSYTGITTIIAGTLQVGDGSTTGALGSGAVTNNAALSFNRSNDLTVANTISGTGTLNQLGAGTLTLTGANSYTGITTITAGTLQVGDGGTTGTLGSGAVTNNAALTFNRSNYLGVANVISGSGTLSKLSAGTLHLSGASSYAGTTTISAGVLRLGAAGDGTNSPLGTIAAGTVVASGATLDLNGFSLSTAEPLSITGAGSGAVGQVGALVNYTTTNVTYSGLLSLGGNATIHPYSGSIDLTNTGTITGSGHTLTLTGQSTNNRLAGILDLGAGGITLPFNGGAYAWTLSGANTYTGTTTIDGGTLKTTHSSALGNGSAVTIKVSTEALLDISGGDLTIGSLASVNTGVATKVSLGSSTLTIGTNNTTTDFRGAIAGTGAVTKVGTGTLSLLWANTYTGVTTVSAGTLAVGNAAALGTTASGTTVASGATLDLRNVAVGAEALTINGGTLAASTGTSSLSGSVVLGADSTVNVGGMELTVSGVVSGTGFGFTKTGTGRVTLSGSNTYTGATTVSAGTLRLGAAGDATNTPLGTAAAGTVVASGATLDLNGFTLGTAEALTINGTGMSSAGAMTNSSATAASYSGLLTLGSSSSIGTSTTTGHIVLSNPGTISGSGFTLTLGGTSTASSLASIVGTDAGGLTKSGTGTWTLTGDNTYTGTTTISNTGTLQVGSGSTTGTLGSGAVVNHAALTFNRSNDLTVASAISGIGTLTKLGAGTLTLTGTDSRTGGTTISAGTLRVGDGGTTGTLGSGAVTNNAAFSFNRSDNLTAANAISGTGTLTKLGAGTLTLSGVSSYTGATTITSGGLVFSNNTRPGTTGFSGSGQLTIEPSTSFSAAFNSGSYTYATTLTGLTFGKSGNTSDITVNSAIQVAGPVTIAGSGLVTISAGITSTATSGTGISLTGKKITQNGNGVIVQTSGANISYTATNVAQTSAGDTGIGVLGTNPNLTPASINAGGGNITLNASFAATGVGGGSDYAIRLSAADLVTSGTGSITLNGNASNVLTSSTPYGVDLSNSRLIAGSGGLTVNYSGNLTSTTSYGIFISSANRASQLLAPSGDISLVDQTSSGRTTGFHYPVYFGATSLRPNIGAAAGSAVTTSSANLTIQGDWLAILDAPIVDTTGAIVVEPVRSSFTADLYTSRISSISTASSVRWGKAGNTSNIIVNTALNAAGPISLYGGNLTLQAGVSTPSSTLTLQATNSITHTASGFVSANSLLLGGGNVTLTHNSNNISTLAASSVGNLSFFNSGGMTIGTVGATSGISSTGTISVATNTGNLTLASNLSTTNATTNAILINAGRDTAAGTSTGGDLIVSGSPVLTAGTGGTIRLMTGSVSGSTGLESLVGSGSGRFRYNSDETSTGYTTALSANVVNAIYRERPAVTVAGTSNVTITYGDSLSLSGTATGMANGDTMTLTVASPLYSGAGLLRYSATPYSASSNLGALGYNVSGLSSTVTVNRKALTVTGLSSANKTYNGLTTATVSGTAALQSAIAAVSGVSSDGRRITSDTVSLSGTATGTFNSKDVASATTVNFGGLSLSGADSANYTLTPLSASYSITPKALNITTPSIASKVYDGSTAAGTVTVGTLSGLVTGETVTATGSATALSSANAASYTTTVSYTLANGTGLATNYSLANSTNVAATIGRATLTVRARDDAKFLTQGDTANFAGVSYTGFVNGETDSVLSGTPTVTRSNASNSSAGNYTGVLQPGGLTLGNYQYNYVNGDFTVVGSNQMLVRVNNASTTYGTAAAYSITSAAYFNGTNVVTLGSGVGSIVDLGNNRFTVNDGASGSATFTVVPSGSQITSTAGQLKVGSYQLQGTSVTTVNAANFSNNLVMVGSHDVATKTVTASIAAAPSGKVYDGNTSMASLVPLSLSGLVASDVVTGNGVGTYASRNAGTSLAYTVENLALAGADAANYRLAAGATVNGTNGTITAKAITLNPQSTSKTYDGASTYSASAADLAAMSALLGVSGDTVSAATLAFADKNVGSNKTLTASAATIADGNSGNNYTVTLGSNSTSAITRLNSVTWVGGASGNWFDPANWAGGAVPDLANVANVVIPSGVTVSFGSTVVAPAQSGAVNIDGLTGAGGNLSQSAGTLNVGAGGITLGNMTQTAGTMVNTGSTTLDAFTQSGGSFTGTGNMTTASFAQTGGSMTLLANLSVTQDFNQGSLGNVSVGGNATITDTVGGLQLGNFSSTGALVVNSTDGAITQASGTALAAQSTSSFTATQGGQPAAIDLSNAGNDFGGAVSLSGSNVSIVDANALTLGNVTATGNLNATAATDLAVNGVVSTNTLTLSATTGNITQGAGSTITVATGPSNFVAGGTVTLGGANRFTGSVNGWVDDNNPSPVPPETPETPQVDTGNTVGVILSGNARNIASPATTLTSSSAPPELVLSASAGTSSAKASQQSNVSNANSEGVTIDVRNAAVQDEPIMAAVSLPKGSATSGTGFSFELPSNLRELVQTPDNVQATLPNGGPLPAWLKFDAQALRFEASAVPDGAFPMQVAIQLGKQRVMVVISERTE